MSQYKPFFLRNQRIKNNCLDLIKELPADDKKPLVVKIQPMTRNLEQNAKFHAMCQDVANQAEFMGRKLTMEQWKVLFISGHAIATNQKADVVPGLEGEFVNIRESSAKNERVTNGKPNRICHGLRRG